MTPCRSRAARPPRGPVGDTRAVPAPPRPAGTRASVSSRRRMVRKLASSRRWIVAASTLVAALAAALVLVPGAEAAVVQPGAGLSTNYDFARLVLRDGGWPTSV